MAAAQQIGVESKPAPDHVPETLSSGDARELRWYLSRSGLFMPEGSTLGAQLERAMLLSAVAPCTACGGKRGGSVPDTPGTGRAPKRGTYRQAIKAWQDREVKRLQIVVATGRDDTPGIVALRAIGILVVKRADLAEIIGPLPDSQTERCTRCSATGWATVIATSGGRPVTARPTGSSRTPWRPNGAQMGDPNLARYGVVSRRLRAVRSADPTGCEALELYHAPGGHYGSVWPMTDTGRELLRDNPMGLDSDRLFANITAVAHASPESRYRGIIAQAGFEAAELVRRGAQAWNRLGPLG